MNPTERVVKVCDSRRVCLVGGLWRHVHLVDERGRRRRRSLRKQRR